MISGILKSGFSNFPAKSKSWNMLTGLFLVFGILALDSCSATPPTNVNPTASMSSGNVKHEAIVSKAEFESAKKRLNVQYDKFTKTYTFCTPVTKADALLVNHAQSVLNFCVYRNHEGPSIALLVAYFSNEYINMETLAINSQGKNYFFDLKKNHSKTLSSEAVSDNHSETSSVRLEIESLPVLANLANSKSAVWRLYGSSFVYDRKLDSYKLKSVRDLVTIIEGVYWGFK